MEERSRVAWIPCASYEPECVRPALSALLAPLGGLEALVKPGDRVLCKVNILMPATPGQAVTTHPALLRAVLQEVKRCGGVPLVGDNSASTPLRLTLQRAGLLAVSEQEGAELVDLGPTVEIRASRGHAHRSFVVSEAMLQADVLVNLPKLKTHALCYMTLAVKNFYGFIPGLHKGRWHLAARSPREFSLLMADLVSAIREHARFGDRMLHVLDGVLAMEGDGPGPGGTPRHLGVLMASRDAVALDRLACHAVGLDASRLLTCEAAARLGLGEPDLARLDVLPEPMPEPLARDWKPPAGSALVDPVGHSGPLGPQIQRLVLERPIVRLERCTGCAQCQRICAAEAIRVDPASRKAKVRLDACIRCYCCAEVCPEAAIRKSGTPPLGRLAGSRWALPVALLLLLGLLAVPLALVLLLFCCGCAASPADPTASPPDPASPEGPGGYRAGVTTLEFTDGRGKAMRVEVWYPGAPEAGDEPDPYPEVQIALDACRDVAPDRRGAPYPLVGFSHGFAGIRYQSAFLTERLATHGFVVVAPDHARNTMLDLDEAATAEVLFERPDDVRAAVDEAIRRSEEGDARLGGMVDGRTWAAVGHSFGAFTVMALGGGRVAWEALAGHCATEGGVICDALDAFDPADGAGHGTSDERVVATVPLAPGVWYAFGEDGRGLSEVRAPLVLGGDKDDVLPYTTEIRPSYEAMTAPKRMGTLADAGHYAFSDICEAAPFLFDDCEEESGGFLDIATAHDITNTLVTAFLGVKLARDGRYAPWIVEDLARTWPALRWEVED